MDFKLHMVKRDKEGHCIKESVHLEDITDVNMYAPNIRIPKNKKHILRECKEVNSNIIIVGNFNTSLSIIDRSSRQRKYRKQGI